jgi:hypothetical protein
MALTKQQQKELWEDYQRQIQQGELELITDTGAFRRYWLEQQNGECPILKDRISLKDASMDHTHKKVSEKLGGRDRKGLVRAILHKSLNALEGKVINYWSRTNLKHKYKLQDILRNLADYYDMIEQGALPIPPKYIYPSEKPKEYKEPVTKTQYNKIKKYYFKIFPRRKKMPQKPRYMNKEWKEYLTMAEEYATNHKQIKKIKEKS